MARKNRRRNRRPTRRFRRRVGARRQPSNPPSINLSPWRRFTVISTATASGDLQALIAHDLIKLATAQLDTPVPANHFSLLKIHRVRVWNMGDGPLVLKPFSTIRPIQKSWVDEPLVTLEDYPGREAFAKCQYVWPKIHQQSICNDDTNTSNSDNSANAVLFEYKAPKNNKLVFHIVVSWKMSTAATFNKCQGMTIQNSSGQDVKVNFTSLASTSSAQSPGSIVDGFEDLGVFSPRAN